MSSNINSAFLSEIKTLRMETLVLKTVCGLIIAKICINDEDPQEKITELTSDMQSVVKFVENRADSGALNTDFSDSIEDIRRLSEEALMNLLKNK